MQARKPIIFFDNTYLGTLNASVRESPVGKLRLSVRARNSLEDSGVSSIGDLVDMARHGIPSPRTAGRKTAADIAGALHALARSVTADGAVDWVRYAVESKLDRQQLEALLLKTKPIHRRCVHFRSPALDRLGATVRRRSLKILHLRPRALNALEAVGITSIGKLVNAAGHGIANVRAAGQQTQVEIRDALEALSKAVRPDGDIDFPEYAIRRNFRLLPENDCTQLAPRDFINVVSRALQVAVESRFGQSGRSLFEQYFFRNDSGALSLRRIGRTLGLTPQAMALRKDRILGMLRGALLEDDYTACHFRFHDVLVIPLRRLKARLNSTQNHAFRLAEWKQAVAEIWAIDSAHFRALEHLFRAVLGFEIVHRSARRFEPIVLPKSRGTSAFGAAQKRIEMLLRAHFPRGLSKSEILKQLQRWGATDLTPNEVSTLTHSITGIECIGREHRFRVRVDRLARLTDQLERILGERGSPMYRRELALEISRFKGRAGSVRADRHVVSAMSRDKRFKPIGRIGLWILARWDIETGVIADVAATCLRKSGRPLTEAELFPLIAARRPVKMNSILSSLRDDGRFRRVAPRTWELK